MYIDTLALLEKVVASNRDVHYKQMNEMHQELFTLYFSWMTQSGPSS